MLPSYVFVFPVISGLVLLVSDGRVNNAMLQPNVKREKSYEVMLKPTPTDEDIQKLASGVVITTQSQRDSGSKTVTAMTKPCYVKRLPNRDSVLQITLCEGRNRQIRKMAEVLGYEVVSLHRYSNIEYAIICIYCNIVFVNVVVLGHTFQAYH